MPSRLGIRFAIEAAFLIGVAVAAGLAELATEGIVIVMAGAWLLTAAVEWAAARRERWAHRFPLAASWPEEEAAPITVEPPPAERRPAESELVSPARDSWEEIALPAVEGEISGGAEPEARKRPRLWPRRAKREALAEPAGAIDDGDGPDEGAPEASEEAPAG